MDCPAAEVNFFLGSQQNSSKPSPVNRKKSSFRTVLFCSSVVRVWTMSKPIHHQQNPLKSILFTVLIQCTHAFVFPVKGISFFGPKSEYIVSGSDCGNIYFWDKGTESIVQWMLGDENGVVRTTRHPVRSISCNLCPWMVFRILNTSNELFGSMFPQQWIWMLLSYGVPPYMQHCSELLLKPDTLIYLRWWSEWCFLIMLKLAN
jgi:WD40 repeat protein